MNINYESPGAHGPPRKGRGEKKLQLVMTVNIYQVDEEFLRDTNSLIKT